MRPTELIGCLEQVLRERGVELTRQGSDLHGRGDDAWVAWDVFCEVAQLPVTEFDPDLWGGLRVPGEPDDDSDLLLHESGESEGRFAVWFTRQLMGYDDAGEYGGMMALNLIVYSPLPEGRIPQAQRWGSPHRFADWRGAVEASNSFKTLKELGPERFVIVQD